MPAFRDDREALLQRAAALERELERTQREAAELREENQALRARVPEPEPEPEPKPEPRPEEPKPEPAPLHVTVMIGTVAAWAIAAFAIGFVPWMLPAAIASTAVAGAVAWRRPRRRPALPPALPLDREAYRSLLDTTRRTVNVQIDVRFVSPLAPDQRSSIEKLLAAFDLATSWEQETLRLRSRRIRVVRKTMNGKTRDIGPVTRYCEGAFAALARLHLEHPIADVKPRASSSRR